MTWNMGHNKATDPAKARYIPWSVALKYRDLDQPILLKGKKTTSYRAPVITEYLDRTTGEILPATVLRDNKELWPAFHFSERCLQREFILNSLRPEVLGFALFVLAFRNKRRGVTPGFARLVKWYAEITGKKASHVRRYIKPLERAGVIAGETLIGEVFQFSGKHTSSKDHSCEDSNASAEFALMRLKERIKRTGIVIDEEPSWLEYVQPDNNVQPLHTDSDALCSSLPAYLRELLNRHAQEQPEACFA